MSSVQVASVVTFLSVLAGTQWAAAQENNAQPQASTHIRVTQVLGSRVNIEGNASIGTVQDIVLDDNGTVEYVIVANQGKLVTVPWDAVRFNFEKRLAMVQITPERFQQIPTYTAEQYPAFSAPAYRTQTYQYYGLTPGQARRLNRRLP